MLKVCLNYQADGHTKFKGNMRADHLILQLTFLWVEEQTYRLVGLVSFEVVFLCLYALIPPFLPLMKAPLEVTFCNSPHLSSRVGLHLFNVIESATSHCFLQLREQEEVAWSKVRGVGRVWEGRNIVFRQKFICGDSPVSRGIVMVQDPIAGTPLLRAMSAHSIVEVLQAVL